MKAAVVSLGLGVVAAGVVAGVLWRNLQEVQAQNVEAHDRIVALQSAQLAASVAPAPAPSSVPVPAVAQVPEANSDQPAAKPATGQAAEKSAPNALMEGVSKIMATPEGRDMVMAQVRMMMPQQYPDLAKELGMSKAEEEKFFDLLARQQADLSGNALAVMGAGADRAAMQELQRKTREQQQAQQVELNAMLGSKAPQWQEYQRTLPVRRQVSTLQTTLGAQNALTDSQSKSLMAAINTEQARIRTDRMTAARSGGGAVQNNPEEQLRREQEDNARLVSAASSHLSTQQLEAYRKMLQQQTDMGRRLMQAVMPQGQ